MGPIHARSGAGGENGRGGAPSQPAPGDSAAPQAPRAGAGGEDGAGGASGSSPSVTEGASGTPSTTGGASSEPSAIDAGVVAGFPSATACDGGEPSPCTDAVCGDGVVEGAEECDDANDDEHDSCLSNCRWNACGDGELLEVVTDPNSPHGAEECDDDNLNPNDHCSDACTLPYCGDGNLQPDGEDRVPGTADDEECDDGNTVEEDECTNACRLPACGDGRVQHFFGEECDLGPDNANDGVSSCTLNCRTLPLDRPQTRLVYLFLGIVESAQGDYFPAQAGDAFQAVIGVEPRRPVCEPPCTSHYHDYYEGNADGRFAGYVRVGDDELPLPSDSVSSILVGHDPARGSADRVDWNAEWMDSTSGSERVHLAVVAGDPLVSPALRGITLPRDLQGFETCTMALHAWDSDSHLTTTAAACLVIDRGSVCGDGVTSHGVETCDDGNLIAGDGCAPNCLWELETPSMDGYRHSVLGFAHHPQTPGMGFDVGDLMVMQGHIPEASSCGADQCEYAATNLVLRAGNFSLSGSQGLITLDQTGRWLSLLNTSPRFDANLSSSDGPAIISSDIPSAPFDVAAFDSAWFNVPGGAGSVVSWHVTEVACAGPCSCSPETCLELPYCGMMPDGCGGWLDCACPGGAACIDGYCSDH